MRFDLRDQVRCADVDEVACAEQQQRAEHGHSLRNEVKQSAAQQRAGGKRNERQQQPFESGRLQNRRQTSHQRYGAHEQPAAEDPEERGHGDIIAPACLCPARILAFRPGLTRRSIGTNTEGRARSAT